MKVKRKEAPRDLCMWAVNNFPRRLKEAFIKLQRGRGVWVRDALAYIVAKELQESGVTDIVALRSRVKRGSLRGQVKKGEGT